MNERIVEIPVFKEDREKIKNQKGVLSYNDFLNKIADNHLVLVGGKL